MRIKTPTSSLSWSWDSWPLPMLWYMDLVISRALGLKPSIRGRFTWVLGPRLLEAVGWEHGQSQGPDPAPRYTKNNNNTISRHFLPKSPPLPTPMVMLAWSYNRGAHHIATTNHTPPPATYSLNCHAFSC